MQPNVEQPALPQLTTKEMLSQGKFDVWATTFSKGVNLIVFAFFVIRTIF
jgi:hypothetical protein